MAKSDSSPEPIFFATPANFCAWLKEHHASEKQLWVGFYRKASGHPSITWPESVDEALCVGWIDGIRKGIDDSSYMIRFTPRKPTSIWSEVNIGRVAELTTQRRMRAAGVQAFARRSEAKSGIYAYEQGQAKRAVLDAAAEKELRARPTAWAFWEKQPPSYRKLASWWIMGAKRDETRQKRLAQLIAQSEAGRRI